MIGNSDNYPEITVKSNNKTQIRYNIVETTIEGMNNESRICYNFEYVEIEGEVTRAKIINEIIRTIYTTEQEIALINNKIGDLGANEYIEYTEYQNFRVLAKTTADNAGYTKII